MTLEELYTAAVQDTNSGQYAEAIRKFELILTNDIGEGDKATICSLLGGVYLIVGNNEKGVQRLVEALAIAPNNAAGWSNLSEGWRQVGRLDEAVEAARKALALKPDYTEAYNNMGNVLKDQGKLDEAITSYRQALALEPDYTNAYNNMGTALQAQGKLDEAITSYRQTLTLKPDYTVAYYNMGNALKAQNKLDEAITSYCQALTLKPDYADAYNNMGIALTGIRFSKSEPHMSEIICKLLEQNNLVRPIHIAGAAVSLPKLNPTIKELIKKQSDGNLASNIRETIISLLNFPLLIKIMESCPIPDLDIEFLLKDIRSALLLNLSTLKNDSEIIPFQISLSMQCFINEYLYENTDSENQCLIELEDLVKINLAKGGFPTANELACLASYKSLGEYSWASSLSMPIELKSLYLRQALEPEKEINLRLKIPKLLSITDNISSKVQEQYEQNPYPRWMSLGLSRSPRSNWKITDELKLKIQDPRIHKVDAPKILIAGCGTGQTSIETASEFKDCDILAVDLSLNSLAYAKRKTEELKILNIEYMQADILDIGEIRRKFDIIESTGVLHHMNDPMAGWKALVGCLNNGGLMKIGLYSELARQHIVKIRDEIKKENINVNDDDMKSFRNQIINSEKEHHERIKLSSDFYNMSSIRDLLFHVQEYRFTIPKIKICLEDLGLIFCGFEHPKLSQIINSNILSMDNIHCLDAWEEFEIENPNTFSGMYQFWCQKI